ncbi:MAG: lysophospholipase [Herbinix sp.]|jgi:dienelactone hydrolase|nr:lysophospholipase [Herbinix sp.]
MKKKYRILKIVLISIGVVLVGVLGIFFAYVSNYSHAQEQAIDVMSNSSVTVSTFEGGIAFGNPDAATGFIFYPGGKVEDTAYAPLIEEIAEGDIFCVIAEMPYQLAVFRNNAAADIMERYPEVEAWYIGGHSLGGAMAAYYAGKYPDQFEGLILLAAYSTANLSESNLKALLMHGSEDQVLNMENYQKYEGNLPSGYVEITIEGGNHAGFGDYGLQKGDGEAVISETEQWKIASEAIIEFIYPKE